MDLPLASQKIATAVGQAQRVLLVSHQRPDYDALGSIVALGEWLGQLGKTYDAFCFELPPEPQLDLLFAAQPFIRDPAELVQQRYDIAIVLDSGDLVYAGVEQLFSQFAHSPVIINIDHHPTNVGFGSINFVDATAASTTEILYDFLRLVRAELSPAIADALLAGILNDTYHFTNPNTNAKTLHVTAQLLRAGARLQAMSRIVVQGKPVPVLKQWGEALQRLRFNPTLGMVTLVIPLDAQTAGLPSDALEGVTNFLNNLGGVRCALVLRQLPNGKIKGSLRTNSDLLDVTKFAKLLGGGGHRKAAGFTINGQLIQDERGVWQVQ